MEMAGKFFAGSSLTFDMTVVIVNLLLLSSNIQKFYKFHIYLVNK